MFTDFAPSRQIFSAHLWHRQGQSSWPEIKSGNYKNGCGYYIDILSDGQSGHFHSELEEDAVIRNFRITAADGKNYNTKHYNLSAIIAVGYKVNSERAVQFRKWATTIIQEYIY